MDSGRHTGGTGTADDDIHVDLFGKIGDRLQDNSGGVDVLGGDVGQNIGAVRRNRGLDRAGVDRLTLGLGNAVVQSHTHGLTGQRRAGNAVDFSALSCEHLSGQLLGGQLPDVRGLFGDIEHDIHDAVFIKGGGNRDGTHAGGRSGVGAGGIESSGCGLAVVAEHRQPQKSGAGGSSGTAFQERAAGDVFFRHGSVSFLSKSLVSNLTTEYLYDKLCSKYGVKHDSNKV